MAVVAVGDFDVDEVERLIRDRFGTLESPGRSAASARPHGRVGVGAPIRGLARPRVSHRLRRAQLPASGHSAGDDRFGPPGAGVGPRLRHGHHQARRGLPARRYALLQSVVRGQPLRGWTAHARAGRLGRSTRSGGNRHCLAGRGASSPAPRLRSRRAGTGRRRVPQPGRARIRERQVQAGRAIRRRVRGPLPDRGSHPGGRGRPGHLDPSPRRDDARTSGGYVPGDASRRRRRW